VLKVCFNAAVRSRRRQVAPVCQSHLSPVSRVDGRAVLEPAAYVCEPESRCVRATRLRQILAHLSTGYRFPGLTYRILVVSDAAAALASRPRPRRCDDLVSDDMVREPLPQTFLAICGVYSLAIHPLEVWTLGTKIWSMRWFP